MDQNIEFSALVLSAAAFVIVVLLCMPFRKMAYKFGIVDNPGGRKEHEKPIPPIGGIIIFSTFMIFGAVTGVMALQVYWPLYVGLILLLMTGALDDQFHLPAQLRFAVHIIAACVIAFYGDVQAAYLGDLFGFGPVWTGFMSYPFTLTAIVLLINAVNLFDGMDGVAAGSTAVMFMWFLIASIAAGATAFVPVLGVLIACIAGFLVFNMRNPWRRKASLFLGDAGSMCLGLAIAWFAVHLARSEASPLEPIAVAWIIGFPIFDTCAQFNRRVREGKSPFAPDRGHFHHHFIDAGVPVRRASVIIIGLIALMGAIGVGGIAVGIPPFVLTVVWIVLLLTHIMVSRKPERYISFIRSLTNSENMKVQCSE